MALNKLVTNPSNFKYNSRELKFGNDRPNEGNSGQPFIKKDLPSVGSPHTTTFPDFLLRDPKNQLETRKDDLERITKFLKTPQGLLFIAKQEALSLQNPIVPGRPNRSTPFAGLYNPLMTLGQVGVAGTGVHIEKQGLLPIFGDDGKYANVYKNEHNTTNTNRLTILYNFKISGSQSSTIAKLNAPLLGISTDDNLLTSYIGGPNVGINGKTVIGFASDRLSPKLMQKRISGSLATSYNKTKLTLTSDDIIRITSKGVSQKSGELGYAQIDTDNEGENSTNFLGQNSVYTLGNTFPEMNIANTTGKNIYTFTQQQLVSQPQIRLTGKSIPQDFRKTITDTNKDIPSNLGLYSFDYTNKFVNKEQRIGLGNPGKITRSRTKLSSYDQDTVDRINILPLYKDRVVLDPVIATRDLVKFRFEVIDNIDPGVSTFIHFRAFLGAITDNFKADWSTTKYIGRGENFYTYNGFSRDINFSFQVAAQSRAEMKSIYQKLNYLASSLAPDYNNGYMKGNLIRLTIGDLYYSLPGFLPSLTYNIPEEASWEIAFSSPEQGDDTGLMETPKYFVVNVSFTPIHDFVPQLGHTSATAFITPMFPKRAEGNSYLDEAAIYNTKNGNDSIYAPDVLKILQKSATVISADNLKPYATNKPIIPTIKIKEEIPTFSPLLFSNPLSGNNPSVNNPEFIPGN
jgi:hypothetical protein